MLCPSLPNQGGKLIILANSYGFVISSPHKGAAEYSRPTRFRETA
jgi:hypothetical protein